MRRRLPPSRSFERDHLNVELGRIAKTRGARLVVHDIIDSTNDEAKRLILAGECGPLWIVAKQQSLGRGRLGRNWESPTGNLHATLIVGDLVSARDAPQLGFVAGLATIKALKAATGVESRFSLKWPNDVLLDGSKLAGMLLEAVTPPVADCLDVTALIGVGVNCATAPKDLPYPAIALTDFREDAPSAARLFSYLSDAMVEALDLWACGAGFDLVRAQWLSHAAGIGRNIRVALAQETIDGRFETVDATGRLMLATDRGDRLIEAGDVFLPREDEALGGAAAFVPERMDQKK
jgi:BirA family biotin operon repressor/biotin-[acetyl-CoA-carboxylase] ligase